MKSPAAPGDSDVGRVLGGRYQLEEVIGRGGMGKVFRATQLGLGRKVAVKLIDASLAGDPDSLRRFLGEAEKTARIDHHHVVKVTDSGSDEAGRPFYVMELLRGQTLAALLEKEGRLSATRAVAITGQILDALIETHKETGDHPAIIHRDLKPRNIMLLKIGAEEDFVKILDFGIAKALDEAAENLTVTGLVPGTRGYVPPEAWPAAGERASAHARMDVFALGAVLYEMVTGKRPWKGWSPDEMALAIKLGRPAPHLRAECPELPEEFDAMTARAMALDATLRYQTVEKFRQALQPFKEPNVECLLPGIVVDDRYTVQGSLGSGRFSTAYQVLRRTDNKTFALKFLRHAEDPAIDENLRDRFLQEAKIGSKPGHPNIVGVVAKGSWRSHLYLVTELFEGRALGDLWSQMTWPRLLRIARQGAQALDALAAQGIVHRDVSPDNILIGADDAVKIFDFGFARTEASDLTRSALEMRMGRWGYMAPEQAEAPRLACAASDQWSLASILYEALTGRPPYMPKEPTNSAEQVDFAQELQEAERPDPPSAKNRTVPLALDEALLRALAREPQARFPNACAFVDAIAVVGAAGIELRLSGSLPAEVVSVPPSRGEVQPPSIRAPRAGKARARGTMLLVGAVVLGSIAATVVALRRPVSPDASTVAPKPVAASPGPAGPVEPPSPAVVTMTLSAKPPDAVAHVGGEIRTLPSQIQGAPGSKITVAVERAGYEPKTVDLTFATGDDHRLVELAAAVTPPKPESLTRTKKQRAPVRRSLLPPPTLKDAPPP